jgi:hypothetical protein
MLLLAQRREVLPNICARLRSDNGLSVSMLVRHAATAAALMSSSPSSALPAPPSSYGPVCCHLARGQIHMASFLAVGFVGPGSPPACAVTSRLR